LLILFRHSLDTGSPLETPYKATVTPIHKGGDKASPQKYRPVCLTSHIVKVLERILRKHIVDHLEQSNLMNKNQHGFRSKHSTLSQLIAFYDQVINKLDKGSTIDAIYIDFAKAFDTVDHGILLHKIRHKAKIAGKIGVWIHNFLSKRVQQVVVNGELSEEVLVTSGVPQGTVLGPVLFLIMIADIDNDVESSHVSMYADDTRIMKQISKESDEENLKYDLSTIYDWCNENNMKFNGDKFELIVFTTKRNEFNEKDYKSPDGKKIEEKSNLKDLGIQLSGNLKFTEHIDTVISKAQKMTGWILRTFNTRDRLPMMTLYKQMVLGILEYCCPLWSPIDKGSIEKIEKVQQSFTRRIKGLYGENRPNYWERLKILKIYSLERRRERYIILYVFKALSEQVPNPGLSVKRNERLGPTIVYPKKRKESAVPDNIFNRNFMYQGSKLFNALPSEIREKIGTDKIETIKRLLDNFLQKVPDQPSCANLTKISETNSIVDQVKFIKR